MKNTKFVMHVVVTGLFMAGCTTYTPGTSVDFIAAQCSNAKGRGRRR